LQSITKQNVRLRASAPTAAPDLKNPALRAWQAHVEAGRIGSGGGSKPSLTFEQRLRHMRNEVAVFGRVVTPELGEF
jgi:hypothetical protein